LRGQDSITMQDVVHTKVLDPDCFSGDPHDTYNG
jgi:hypothetical protein